MKEGNVILAALPQADGLIKSRPAIILREMQPYRDLLVCGVSSQLHQQVKDFDEIVSQSDDDFTQSGLDPVSLIRLGFLALIIPKRVLGIIGSISPERHRRLLEKLSTYLIK
jgi:mRNA interferase MazF